VMLCGAGRADGSEMHESGCALLSLAQVGLPYRCFAPDAAQTEVVNHLTGKATVGESRNMLVEAARIARGEISDLAKAQADDLLAIVIPGGLGCGKNFCSYAYDGAACHVNADLERLIVAMHAQRKPIVALCLAPVIVARVLGGRNVPVKVTIGNDAKTSAAVQAMGAIHEPCAADRCVVDEEHRVLTTPCYMNAASVAEVYAGVKQTMEALSRLLQQQ